LIQSESGTSWKEMYQVFNMGSRLEIYLEPDHAEEIIAIAKSFNIDSQIIGFVEEASSNKLTIKSAHGEFEY